MPPGGKHRTAPTGPSTTRGSAGRAVTLLGFIMLRSLASATALTLAATGTLLVSPAASVAAPAPERARLTATPFVLGGSGFGTKMGGGDVPVGSDTTAYQALGCTNKAGLDQDNDITSVTLPGAGEVGAATTRVWTTKARGVVSSWSRNSIARVVLGDAATGEIELNGITSQSRAFHGDKGFKAAARTSIASVTYTPAAGEPQELDVPTPGQPLEIPGVATIEVGKTVEKADRRQATAEADAVLVHLAVTGTRVRIAHSKARISEGVRSGLFRGRSAGLSGRGLEDNVNLGHQPLSLMPCQGTDGELRRKSIASLDLGDGISVRGVTSRQQADQTMKVASGFERGRVDTIDINDGQLLITKVVGRVNVTRMGKRLERNIDGTTIGTITADGEPQEFPDTDVLEIPGVARLERSIVERVAGGLAVTSLRITLLDGSGGVLELGQARLVIRGRGL